MSGPILTLDNLFNGSNQEETLEVVEILPKGVYTTGYSFTIADLLDYDYLEVVHTFATEPNRVVAPMQLHIDRLEDGFQYLDTGNILTTSRVLSGLVIATGVFTVISVEGDGRLAGVTGYKKRYSTTSLEQLLVMAQKPNIFVNSDHTKLPFNQRNFNGNWSALSDGQYGLDRWMKYSSTHKGFAVDDGEYLPNTPYTFDAEGITRKTLISPASGIWGIAVPFAADKMNGRCGRVLGDWHPEVQESKENSCLRHFVMGIGYYIPTPVTGQLASAVITYPSIMRKVPSLTRLVVTGTATFNSFQKVSEKAVSIVLNGAAGTSQSGELQADASITKAEVGRWDVLS